MSEAIPNAEEIPVDQNEVREEVRDHQQDERAQHLAGMRALCDLLEANPEITLPIEITQSAYTDYWGTKDSVLALKNAVGRVDKFEADHLQSMGFKAELPHNKRLVIYIPREQVCKARVVGTKTILVKKPAEYEEKVVNDVVWDCEPLLGEN